MFKKLFLIILFSTTMLPGLCFARPMKSASAIYEEINPAIVSVDSQLSDGLSCGTGCIIDKSGVILTSAHVVDVGKSVVVTTNSGQNYTAKVLKHLGDNKDIALLKIDAARDLKTVKLGTLTQGIISRIDYAKNRIQTDAAINPGSSGGPLLNQKGEIIGINQAIYNPDNNISNIGIGFATPINLVKEYLKESG